MSQFWSHVRKTKRKMCATESILVTRQKSKESDACHTNSTELVKSEKVHTFFTQNGSSTERKEEKQKKGPGRELNPGPPPNGDRALRRNHTTRPPGRYFLMPKKLT